MRTRARAALLALAPAALLAAAFAPAPARASRDFPVWLEGVRSEARERGISEQTLEVALQDLRPVERVIELDRRQPGAPSEFCSYMERRLTRTRIARGRRMLEEQDALLRELADTYGVPARYLVALWGLETNFGDYMGDFPVISAVATLAHEGRREELFREQLFAALEIVEQGHQLPSAMLGSWAGAIGQVQFMPTTFLEHAVDHDGDGRKDIWSSVPDALASAASYLRRAGWRSGESWGRQVRLPAEIGAAARTPRPGRSLSEWQALGVRGVDGGDLPAAELRGAVVLPLRRDLDPAFLAYRNYWTFLDWNRSTFFALSLGTLADAIGGLPGPDLCEL
jgi:membrane-bound lytic murein transglycosylase B